MVIWFFCFFFTYWFLVSRRCVPFNVDQSTIQQLQAQINMQWADFVKAVNNIEILANINGVGKFFVRKREERFYIHFDPKNFLFVCVFNIFIH